MHTATTPSWRDFAVLLRAFFLWAGAPLDTLFLLSAPCVRLPLADGLSAPAHRYHSSCNIHHRPQEGHACINTVHCTLSTPHYNDQSLRTHDYFSFQMPHPRSRSASVLGCSRHHPLLILPCATLPRTFDMTAPSTLAYHRLFCSLTHNHSLNLWPSQQARPAIHNITP